MPMTTSVTRLDDFLMFSVNKFLTKIAQICDYILGYFENITFQIKTSATNFGNQLWENLPYHYSTSDHTEKTTSTRLKTKNRLKRTNKIKWNF